jgi:hypothetical protein
MDRIIGVLENNDIQCIYTTPLLSDTVKIELLTFCIITDIMLLFGYDDYAQNQLIISM